MPKPRFVARVRFVLVRTRRRLAGRLWQAGRRFARPLLAPRDRHRAPWTPSAVVAGGEFDSASMAAADQVRRYAGPNPRFASCTGAAWTRPDRLVTAYLLGRAFVTSTFEVSDDVVSVRRGALMADRSDIGRVTNVKVSRDGRWLVYGDDTYGHAAVLAVDPATGSPMPSIAATVKVPGDGILHAATFSPDGRHLLYSSIDDPGGLRVVPFAGDPATGTATFGPVACEPNPYFPAALKAIDFSPDGRWLALAYGANAGAASARSPARPFVEIRPWDAANGTALAPVARSPRSWRGGGFEDVTWLAGGDRLLVTDQFRDQALIVACDPGTGALGPVLGRISWAAGGLRAPHGCAQSPDGRWLAVTNYGDGSLRLFDTTDPAGAAAVSTA